MSNKNDKTTAKKRRPRKKEEYFDYNLLAVVIILICFGLIMLYSASSYEALVKRNDDMFYFAKQSIIFIVAIVGAMIASKVDYHRLVRYSPWIYWIAMGLMLLVHLKGSEANGATRWLSLGPLSFQPSELAKIAVILILAYLIVNFGKLITMKRNFIFLLCAVVLQFFGAFYLTENLSTAIIILGIGAGIIFIYYPKTRPLILMALFALIVLLIGLYFLKNYVDPSTVTNFRLRRILNWFDRESNVSEGSYQVMQGLYAIGSGGFFGKGLGNSSQKLTRIPEAQNDMIFSIICEELGLFGAILLMVLFGYLLYRLYYIAQNARDLHGSIIATGVLIHFSLQIILNMAVVLNLIPTTGVSLPFVSYGGTAIMFLMAEIGICLNISRQIKIR